MITDGYDWNDKAILLVSLTRACKLQNDRVKTRLPIGIGLLELILFEIKRVYGTSDQPQPYLGKLYLALLSVSYYGMLWIGEATLSQHGLKACNVHIGINKDKLLLVLYSSKTHSKANHPQKICITARDSKVSVPCCFCPFRLVREYLTVRGEYYIETDQFFVFSDGSPMLAAAARKVLRQCITRLGLTAHLYDFHSLRIGRSSDLAKFGFHIDLIKHWGRWKSNSLQIHQRLIFYIHRSSTRSLRSLDCWG